jgi:lysine-N-methylase
MTRRSGVAPTLRLVQERRLPTTTLIRPQYANEFRCIGPACEDTCCAGWRVDIDAATYEKYQGIPAGPLRTMIDEQVVRFPPAKAGAAPLPFARVNMPASLACPFLNADRLCQIQVEHGAEYLSQVCATFPRAVYVIDQMEDKTLSLSCPEAARLVLLNPTLLNPDLLNPDPPNADALTARAAPVRTVDWDEQAASSLPFRNFFWAVREFSIGLIRNRSYPLWQRMFLLGTFARRLDAVARGDLARGFPALLKDFSAAVAQDSLRDSIAAIPADLALQLDVVMQLVKLRIGDGRLQPRLRETLNAFADGVGFPHETTLEGQCTQYALGYARHYAPFFGRHPHILENLLINMIFRGLFPLGKKLFDAEVRPEPAREFAMLATEFALIKGVLIGVAAWHKEKFSTAHVVQTVQVITKYFEHNSAFLSKAYELLVARKLDDARGLTMLLRN